MRWLVAMLCCLGLLACASGGGGAGKLGQSSTPINKKESILYKQAIIRCHKTGGTRVIKINGILRCF